MASPSAPRRGASGRGAASLAARAGVDRRAGQPADRHVLVVLDQVTDPQNVGAIFRSAAAFGARGVVLQERHAPPLAGALAKAAAGAVDTLPHAREVNLARALERLETLGWRAVGLAPDASEDLAQTLDGGPTVLVLGAEGEGLRRLVREHCDTVAAITLASGLQSLNVAAAAAIALFQAARAPPAVSGVWAQWAGPVTAALSRW